MRSPMSSILRWTWVCRSRASTSVVLPWSTWAMIAMLRISFRRSLRDAKVRHVLVSFRRKKRRPDYRASREAVYPKLCAPTRCSCLCFSRLHGMVMTESSRTISMTLIDRPVQLSDTTRQPPPRRPWRWWQITLISLAALVFGAHPGDWRLTVVLRPRPAGSRPASELPTESCHTSVFQRQASDRAILHRTAHFDAAAADSRTSPACRDRCGRCAILRASGLGLHRHSSCCLDESAPRRKGRGSQHDYAAVGAVAIFVLRADVRSKSARVGVGLQDGAGLDQGTDSRDLSQSDLLRPGCLWSRVAAQSYFGKDLSALTVAEAAFPRGTAEISESFFSLQELRACQKATGTCVGSNGGSGFSHAAQHEEAMAEPLELPAPR